MMTAMKSKPSKQTSNVLMVKSKPATAVSLHTKFQMAVSFHSQGSWQDAAVLYDDIIAAQPGHADALHMRGMLHAQASEHAQAVKLISQAIALDATKSAYFNNRGLAFLAQQSLTEALADFQQSIALEPRLAQAHCNLGNVLQELLRFEAALLCFDRAIDLQPDYADAYFNRGNLWVIFKRPDKAIEDFDRALGFFPDDADFKYNKSIALLINGQYESGWKFHEARWDRASTKHLRRQFSATLWLGRENIKNKKILLYAEQGLGDTIQFIRYVHMVVQLGAQVFVEIQSPLIQLFQGMEDVITWIKKGEALPIIDFHCPLMSLPLAFKTRLNNIPSFPSYLSCDKTKKKVWENKLAPKNKPRIGIAWSGSSTHKNDQNRSISLAVFKSIISDDAVFYSLQNEYRAHDIELIHDHPEIIDSSDQLQDFSDTASLCDLMDLIITVDTSVAHLSGALGKSTWVLVPHNPDFRWFVDRQDSPWYPSIKLFRQNSFHDWNQTLAELSLELKKFIATE